MHSARTNPDTTNNLNGSSPQSRTPDETEMKDSLFAAEPTPTPTSEKDGFLQTSGFEVSTASPSIIASVLVAVLLIASGVFLLSAPKDSTQLVEATPTPTPEPVVCTADVSECPDGSFVSRDPAQNCKFAPCPGEGGSEATPTPSPVGTSQPTTQPTVVPTVISTSQPSPTPTPSPSQSLANLVMENIQCHYRVTGYEPAPAPPGEPQQYEPNLYDGMTITIPSEYKDAEKKMYCRYTFQNIEDVQTGVVHERHVINGDVAYTGEHPPLNKGEGRSSYRIYDMGTGQQSMQFEVNYKRTFEEEKYDDNRYTINFTVVQQ